MKKVLISLVLSVLPTLVAANDLCWYHKDGVDYRLSLIDLHTGVEILEGNLVISPLTVEDWGVNMQVVRYSVPPDIEESIGSITESSLSAWVIFAQQIQFGSLTTGEPTVIREVTCSPPYTINPPRLKADFTCDDKVTVTDSLKHLRDEVVGSSVSCE